MTTTTSTTATQDVPREMKAAAVEKKGAPVATKTVPVPKPGNGEVLVRVDIAGVGVWDPALVSGEFTDRKTPRPHVYGAEGAGTVVAVGKNVSRAKVGDMVYGYGFGNAKGGFFAEYTALPEENVAPLPPGLTSESAGALAVSGLTALKGLELLDFDDGEPILIIGASGGVGHIAIQL
ncbi:MAG TPA: alcohol dehydrogenase catalytic domain-containing protein, partial [Myxococcota bacterium]